MDKLTVLNNETKAATRFIRRTGTGTVLRLDAGDPADDLVEADLDEAQSRREKPPSSREQESQFFRRRIGAVAATLVLAVSGGTFVRNSVESGKIPTTTLSGAKHELAAERSGTKVIKFYELTMHNENDLWRYIELFSVKENIPISEVQSIIEDANPGVDFTKIPKGGKVKVPELTYASFAGNTDLETDQPIGDIHTT